MSNDELVEALRARQDLSNVDLSGADLRDVDFSDARLVGANFSNARLANAQFAGADLSHANFTGATGVVGAQFARANLTGAQLPSSVHFGALDTAAEVAVVSAKLFVTMLLVCAYSWLTINSTLDAKLITDTAVSQLPILNAQIPIVNFYALVPLALVGMSIVAMVQAQRLWAAVAAAPAATPDGMTTADRAGSWLVGAWAVSRIARPNNAGHGKRSAGGWLGSLQSTLAMFVGWWIVPLTVAWFWVRYLHRHDWSVTLLQLAALTVGATASAAFLALAKVTLPKSRAAHARPRGPWHAKLSPYLSTIGIAIGVPFIFGTASYAAINGVHHDVDIGVAGQNATDRPAQSLDSAVPAVQARVPRILASLGLHPYAQLSESDISTRLDNGPTATTDTTALPKASGARLIGADLRFASAERVFLAFGDLRQTDLLGADLWSANLAEANITGASFVGSLMYGADLRKVRAAATAAAARVDTLKNAPNAATGLVRGLTIYRDTLLCNRALFTAANMRYADFRQADLRGASFDDGLLQGARFAHARLQRATFDGADLDGADFRKAIGLTPEQVIAARLTDALYDSSFLAVLKARDPDDFATYNAVAIAAEAERQRLSGEDEPDSMNLDDHRGRDKLIRAAFDSGTAVTPSHEFVTRWIARGHQAPGSTDAVPYGCTIARDTVLR